MPSKSKVYINEAEKCSTWQDIRSDNNRRKRYKRWHVTVPYREAII